jgi:hypothetical protein
MRAASLLCRPHRFATDVTKIALQMPPLKTRRRLIALAVLLPSALAGQSAPTGESSRAIMFQFLRFADIYGSRLVAAFDSIPARQYTYRPTPPQQTVGYIAQHLENANYSQCERLAGVKHPRTSKDSLPDTIKAKWPKDTLVSRLRASLRFCDAALEQVPKLDSPMLASVLLGFETDLAEHYSQISSYMRLLGMVPPSALPPRERKAIELPVSALSPYVGVYEIAWGLDLDVTLRDGALFISSNMGGAPTQLWPESASDFFAKGVDAQVTFVRDASGAVSGLVLHQNGRDQQAKKRR